MSILSREKLKILTPRLSRSSISLSIAVSLAAIAVSFGIHGFTPAFVISALNAIVVSNLPGWMLTIGILSMGSSAQMIGLVLSAGGVFTLYGLYSLLGLWMKEQLNNTMVSVVLPTVGIWGTETILTGQPSLAVYSSLGGGVTMLISHFAASNLFTEYAPKQIESSERRRVLSSTAAALTTVLWGYSIGRNDDSETQLATVDKRAYEQARHTTDTLNSRSLDVRGLEPLVSKSFFEVDVSAVNPSMDSADYSLTVRDMQSETSEVFSYTDIVSKQSVTTTQTLRCVGEARNGKKMDNAVWTAVPLTNFIDFDEYSDTCCVVLRAEDGYYEEFPLAALETGYLAYGMNAELLPRRHGYPIRALIPGHWGEINVKWLTDIEIQDEEIDGYWEERGWHGTGPVNTVAKLHAVNSTSGDTVEVAGHAYAGTRGVSAVEVSTDGGETWNEATLSDRIDGEDVWRQWSYQYVKSEEHQVVVRAIENDGTVQTKEETGSFPSGPTGYVSRTITP